jgi:hypothetical protein
MALSDTRPVAGLERSNLFHNMPRPRELRQLQEKIAGL